MTRPDAVPGRRMLVVAAIVLAAFWSPASATGQEAARLLAVDGALALAADPLGRLYISLADRVILVDTTGAVIGTAAQGMPGEVFSPAGLDPTNGLILLVADPESGRLNRFARDGRFLEAFPITPEARAPTLYGRQDAARSAAGRGRPTDVATTQDGRTFVLDASSGLVLVYDRNRRLLRRVGQAEGDELPVEPVALAGSGDRVYVCDRGLPGIVLLDRFGAVESWFGAGIRPSALAHGASGIWVASGRRVLRFSEQGRLEADFATGLDVVDLAESGGRLFVLARDGLYALRV